MSYEFNLNTDKKKPAINPVSVINPVMLRSDKAGWFMFSIQDGHAIHNLSLCSCLCNVEFTTAIRIYAGFFA